MKLDQEEVLKKSINLSEAFRRTGNQKAYRQAKKAFTRLHDAKKKGSKKRIISALKELAAMLRHYGKLKVKRIAV
jgi:cell fate (sporulation/competence/biofilm development) regulator YmcA (YheA/YmcA/DUF963 family)